jgi:hypothetical protein
MLLEAAICLIWFSQILVDYDITFPDSGIIKPDTYHPLVVIGVTLPLVNHTQNCEYSYRKYGSGDYTLLYNILSNYDWSFVYDTSSVDAAAASLSGAVQGALQQAIPRGFSTIKNSTISTLY